MWRVFQPGSWIGDTRGTHSHSGAISAPVERLLPESLFIIFMDQIGIDRRRVLHAEQEGCQMRLFWTNPTPQQWRAGRKQLQEHRPEKEAAGFQGPKRAMVADTSWFNIVQFGSCATGRTCWFLCIQKGRYSQAQQGWRHTHTRTQLVSSPCSLLPEWFWAFCS